MQNLAAKAYELRKDVLNIVMAGKGGHIGGDMSVMEILTALYFKEMNISPENMNDPDRDLFVLSKGHSVEALYAVLAAKGFFPIGQVISEYARFGSEFIGHPNNKLPGIEMNAGSLGHGLPVCVGMALARKKDGRNSRVYTVMGDGELAEGSIWEAAMSASQYKLDNLLAVVDRNRLQISGPTEEIMHQDDVGERFAAFGWNVITVDGNNVDALCAAFDVARSVKGRPSIVIANTVKGCGSPVMENKASWHHRVPTQEEYIQIMQDLEERRQQAAGSEGAAVSKEQEPIRKEDGKPAASFAEKAAGPEKNTIPNRQAICETLMKAAEKDRDIVVLCSDSRGSASLTPFAETYPDQFVETGIAEQDLVSIAAGLAKCGKKPFAASPACFLAARSYEQAKIDVAYSNTNVKLIGISGGVSYGALGMSHHSAQDIAAMAAIPNMRVYIPSDRFQTAKLIQALLQDKKPAYVRVGRNAVEDVYREEDCPFEMDRATLLCEGTDIAIIACGEMVAPAYQAAGILKGQGVSASVLDMYCIKPLDTKAVIRAAQNARAVLTVEEHSPFGGLGSMVAQTVSSSCPKKVINLSLPDTPVITGTSREVFDYYGLNAEGIARTALENLHQL